MRTFLRLLSLRFFAKVPDIDRQNSTRVGQFFVSRGLVGRFDEAWQKTFQVFRRNRLANLEQGIKRGCIGLKPVWALSVEHGRAVIDL